MSKRLKQEISRRQALQYLGAASTAPLFTNPVAMLIESMVQGLIQEARAEVAGRKPRNLIVFYMTGGAPRWHFEGAHDPYKPDASNGGNKQLINGFVDGKPALVKKQFDYSQGRRLYLPPLMGSTITPSSGKSLQMADLLRNAMVVQGVNMLSDGHSSNALALVMPNPNGMTYGGMIADASSAEVAAVGLPQAMRNHKAPSGAGIALLGGFGDPLNELLGPFQRKGTDANYLSRRDAMDVAMKTALQKLGTFASSSDPAALALFSSQSKAESLLKRSLGDLSSAYTTLRNKYNTLIRATIDASRTGVAGVTDKPVPGSMFSDAEKKFAKDQIVDLDDLRDLINPKFYIDNLAENFAVTEYMITNGFSQYVSAYMGNVINAQSSAGKLDVPNGDEHEVGAAVSLMVNTARYRAFYVCLAELIDVLKQKGLWNESVILYGSEFNRAPRADGSGSDHGWNANIYTMMSGAIDGPYYVGNTTGPGGVAAPTKIGAAVVDSTVRGYVASTVATLARINSPSSNNSSFLVETTGGGTYTLGGVELSKGVSG